MKIKHILFDIDETLFPTSKFVKIARKNAVDAMVEMGIEEDPEKLYNILLEVIEEKGSNYSYHFSDLCNKIGIKENQAKYIAAAVNAYHNSKSSIHPYPDVPKLLLLLKEQGYNLHVATNGLAIKQWDKLIRLKVALFFDQVFISEEMNEEKSKNFFIKVLKELKAKPQECLMVGDSPTADIEPAKKAGLRTIRVLLGKYSKEKSNADTEIKVTENRSHLSKSGLITKPNLEIKNFMGFSKALSKLER